MTKNEAVASEYRREKEADLLILALKQPTIADVAPFDVFVRADPP